jgi:hypothetical protein
MTLIITFSLREKELAKKNGWDSESASRLQTLSP